MYLDSNKTGVLIWYALLLICSFQSPLKASGSLGGIKSTVDKVTVDGVEPWDSASGNVSKQSSDCSTSETTGPCLGRHLVQSSASSSADEDALSCQLTQSQRREYYTRSTRVWTITDKVLEELENDVQFIVSCAASDDTILISTRRTIQPRRSIIISRNLTLAAHPEGPLLKNGIIGELERKVKLHCPKSGNLLTIRSGSALVANLIFKNCNGTSNMVSIETSCDENSSHDIIEFLHVEFKNLILAGGNRILEAVQPTCAHLWLENVIIRRNRCGKDGCLALSTNNTLTDVHVAGNRAADVNSTRMSPVFVLPADSEAIATNVSALNNAIRLFNVTNSTLTLRASYFDGNAAKPLNISNGQLLGGSVLISNSANILVSHSVFVNNSGWRGGAIYAVSSELDIRNCIFRGNVGILYGGALYSTNASSITISSCTFSKNNAVHGAGIFSFQSSSLHLLNSRFWENNGTRGAGLYVVYGNMSVESCEFQRNNASYIGGGLVAVALEGSIQNSTFLRNNATLGGAFAAQANSTVTTIGLRFEGNHARDSGGAVYATNSTLAVRNASLDENWVSDDGSALFAQDGALSLRDVDITDNFADNDGTVYTKNSSAQFLRVLVSGNVADWGGGLYFIVSNVTIRNSTFENNSGRFSGGALRISTSRIQISNTIFHNNTSGSNGGGIYAYHCDVALSKTNFTNNTGDTGGGCYFSGCNGTFQQMRFMQNRAIDGSGGGIYMTAGRFHGESLTFHENQASIWGGGVCALNLAAMDLSLTSVYNNTASYGGGICAERLLNLSLATIQLENNVASGSGGGIYGEELPTMTVLGVRFHNNTARYGGGGYFSNVSTTMQNVTAFKNRAIDGSGGGIYLINGSLKGESLTFRENQASNWGGGVYALDLVVLHLSDVNFHRNSGSYGGAIGVYNTTLNISRLCAFTRNNATTSGGSIFQKTSQSTISLCHFEYDTARYGGSLWVGEISNSSISDCIFHNSTASSYGGGIEISNNTKVSISNSTFSKCGTDSRGGAIHMETRSNLTVSTCRFSRNRVWYSDSIHMSFIAVNTRGQSPYSWLVSSGGSIRASSGTVDIQTSTFQRNNVSDGDGGALYFSTCNVTIRDTRILSNRAKNYGGIGAEYSSFLNVTNISMNSNVATEDGGGMGIYSGSSLLCIHCEFRNNTARWGGGMATWNDDSVVVVAQLQDATFVNNTALSYGGGLHFRRPMNTTIDCSAPNMTCSRVALLNTMFVNNSATFSGSAILTSDPLGVLVSCRPMEAQYDFMDQDQLSSMIVVQPKKLCRSWRRNQLSRSAPGDVVGTYGRVLSFSTQSEGEAQIIGDVESGFVLQNVASGKQLPVLYVIVLDAYGNGPLPTQPHTLEATMISPDGFFQGLIPTNITGGAGNFSNIVGFKPPGNYTIRISPNTISMFVSEITVQVRECRVGEEPTINGELCQECDAVSYNFDPQKAGGCSPCPNDATCESRYIIPKDGYWHQSPCHPNIKQCLSEEACSYKDRQEQLKNYSINHLDCDFNESMLMNYSEVLCRDGFEGPLCGSCSNSYGLAMGFKCSKCPHRFGSVVTLIFVTLFLLAISSFTIRGGLPLRLKTLRVTLPSTSASRSEPDHEQQRDRGVNLEMVKMLVEGRVPSAFFRSQHEPSTSNAPPPDQSNDLKLTKWITTEIFKVMINFLQVTAVAASIGVQWTEGILIMFEASEYLGALTTAAISRPIDCIVSGSSAISRSIWRMLVSLFVPGVVMSIFAAIWGFITFRESKAWSYFWKRLTLTVVAVTYISYLGLTKLAVRMFYCVDVSDSVFSSSRTKYLALDTAIKCYEKGHFSLIVVAVFILTLVSLTFPLALAIVLFKNKNQQVQANGWTHETVGFLFRGFKTEFVFWESLIMFRKACLSVIVVFSYPLGGQAQGLLALVVLMFCLYLQMACSPYKKEFHNINYYESGSLLVSCLTFTFGQFLTNDRCSETTKSLVEISIILLNTAFFAFLLVVFLRSGINHLRVALIFEGHLEDDNAPWWLVVKSFMKSGMSKVNLSTH